MQGEVILFDISVWKTVKLHQCLIYQKHHCTHCSPIYTLGVSCCGFSLFSSVLFTIGGPYLVFV